jgi:hypothetical protein
MSEITKNGMTKFDRRILLCIIFCIVIIILVLVIINYTDTNSGKKQETYFLDQANYGVIKINDYNGDWNHLCELIMSESSNQRTIIVECEKQYIFIIGNALTFMIDDLSVPVIVTENIEEGVNLAKNNNMLPFNIMIANGDKLVLALNSYEENGFIFGNEPPSRTITNDNKMTIKRVDPNIDIAIANSSDTINLVESCKESDALILNIKDSNHMTDNLNMQLKYLSDNGMPNILVNQLNGDLLVPSYKMSSEAAYAKLAVIMSNLEEKELIEPVFAKNFKNEFL